MSDHKASAGWIGSNIPILVMLSLASIILTCNVPIIQHRFLPNTMDCLQVSQTTHFRQVCTMHPRYHQAPP